jgi:hypothetical protein
VFILKILITLVFIGFLIVSLAVVLNLSISPYVSMCLWAEEQSLVCTEPLKFLYSITPEIVAAWALLILFYASDKYLGILEKLWEGGEKMKLKNVYTGQTLPLLAHQEAVEKEMGVEISEQSVMNHRPGDDYEILRVLCDRYTGVYVWICRERK